MRRIVSSSPSFDLRSLLSAAVAKRRALVTSSATQAYRIFSGVADGIDGVFIDVYGPGATLIVYEGRSPRSFDATRDANAILDALRPLGVRAVYVKPFAQDRSHIGGTLPAIVTDPAPSAGETLPDAILVREHRCTFEVRLFDGLSTGLFLDQRDNREFVRQLALKLAAGGARPAMLNTFAYTCAFSVAAAMGGARTTSVDVSARYLDWGKRNFAHNAIDVGGAPNAATNDEHAPPISDHRFARMDTFEFFAYARRKSLRYDLIVLDPPSFGSGSKKRGIKPWSAENDYPRLVREAAALLHPRGVIFASTNTQSLCRAGRLDREIVKGLGRPPRWIDLPRVPSDFAAETDRFAARAFHV